MREPRVRTPFGSHYYLPRKWSRCLSNGRNVSRTPSIQLTRALHTANVLSVQGLSEWITLFHLPQSGVIRLALTRSQAGVAV